MPWRHSRDPWAIWVSEILLQQTRVETVIPYYHRFLEAFPTPAALATASLEAVLKLWEGLGYYARARNLHRAAAEVVSRHGGQVPRAFAEVLALPGVGRSTAGSILCFAHGQAHPVLDGNVQRVLLRVLGVPRDPTDPAVRRWLWSTADILVRGAARPGDYNQGLLDLGATVCTPRGPRCADCPVASWCTARRQGQVEVIPVRRPRGPLPHQVVAVALITRRRDGRILVQQRPAEGLLGGLWELPGGKQAPEEALDETVRRELREELGVRVQVGARFVQVAHAYSHFRVTLHAFHVRLAGGRPRPLAARALRWVSREELAQLPIPKATQKVLDALDL